MDFQVNQIWASLWRRKVVRGLKASQKRTATRIMWSSLVNRGWTALSLQIAKSGTKSSATAPIITDNNAFHVLYLPETFGCHMSQEVVRSELSGDVACHIEARPKWSTRSQRSKIRPNSPSPPQMPKFSSRIDSSTLEYDTPASFTRLWSFWGILLLFCRLSLTAI